MKRASDYGFSVQASGEENSRALQRAVLGGGTILVDEPGDYRMRESVLLDDHTALLFGAGVRILREEYPGGNYLLVNRGAYERLWNCDIRVEGLHIVTQGCCVQGRVQGQYLTHEHLIPGLRGQIAFFYVKRLVVRDYTCLDLPPADFGIHVCTFEDILLENLHIEGRKDAVHLGRGRRFVIRHGLFRTYDDPIALNAHDYATSNPQLGWIEDGLIEDCYDLDDADTVGYFCRILAGSWCDWREGMVVQHSDSVVSEGRVYRVLMRPDGTKYVSRTRPTHASGEETLDGIRWVMVQEGEEHECGCRRIHFRDIHLEKHRPVAFSVHFDHDDWSRSVYPGSAMPVQSQITFEHVYVQSEVPVFLRSITPMDTVRILHCDLPDTRIRLETLPGEAGRYPEARFLLCDNTYAGGGLPVDCEPGRAWTSAD